MTDKKIKLRSSEWFGPADKNGFMYRSWMKNQGIPDHEFDGRPIIGICNTWSELTPCNAHFRKIAEHVKRGVSEAGGWHRLALAGGDDEATQCREHAHVHEHEQR